MTTRTRHLTALAGLPLLLVAVGCTPKAPGAQESPSSSASASASSSEQSPSSSKGVAAFDASKHQTQSKYSSPDRTSFTSEAKPEGFAAAPAGSGMQRYLDQKIDWKGCDTGLECGTVLVPLDWDNPDGDAITLKMKRKAAGKDKTATLFINPGGPGGSGQDMVGNFDATSFPTHDVIGWDPRGSGESTPVKCGTPEQTDAYVATDSSPDDEAEWGSLEKANKDFAAQCREKSGALLDHISTIDTARDLDYLRHLVGDEKLDYLGISYGTYIGSMYAELYPQRVGKMVLDSAVNITTDESVIQAMGFDLALKNYADWCAKQSCALGTTQKQVLDSVTGILKGLDAKPLKVFDRTLTQSQGVTGMVTYLYFGDQGYSQLTSALVAAKEGDGSQLLQTSDMMNGRNEDGTYGSMMYSFPAIACADSEDPGAAGARKELAKDIKKAPILAPFFGPNVQCSFWSAKPSPQLKLQGKGAAPIVVLGATGDPATPYQQAVWMADQLESGVLVTWKGAGHSAWDLGNACVKTAVKDYVNKGTVPKDKTVC
ncbi:probable exported protease [Luteococcus japonicus LSP_Lj1]|uniref:Probable exported protease n=1 Tax=Luteococcus japonicus LSP_Lj1 TaxID=1255658 RepID=A0A1R4IDC8_9ACTN|nr:alpha/beta hydrolase [Luteococcus japonicus]SJN17273.1 probable exported protease [Luteococcus japonicus LSP_Lj1]